MITLILAAVLQSETPAIPGIIDPGTKVEVVASGFRFTEGPVWWKGQIHFSDIPANRIYRVDVDGVKVFREPSNNANGNRVDRKGRLLTAEHGSRRVTRTSPDGHVEVLAERFEGKRLNSPNDLVEHPSGRIYFTDPPYGIQSEQAELGFNGVFMVSGKEIHAIARDFDRPNGIGLSPNGDLLYVSDTAKRHIRVFVLGPDGKPRSERVFAEVRGDRGSADGLRVDQDGNVYCTGPGGVQVFAPNGNLLGTIRIPEVTTNVAWGGDGRWLYVTSPTTVFRVRTVKPGLQPG